MADGVQGNVTEYNAMDVMFGNELPHMGLMGHATSAFMDPGLDYTLGYSQVQLYTLPESLHASGYYAESCWMLHPPSESVRCCRHALTCL